MRRIDERWIVGEPLGEGGMASIFRGHHETLGHAVAIKLLKRSLLDDPFLRNRFNREAVALASVSHPNIVDVLDYGESDDQQYMVLELVEGETLERLIERTGPMPVERAGALFDQLLSALEVCHAREIVHRDVKPANVMLTSDKDGERVVLIDFGLARIRGALAAAKLTETGVVHGTAQYMAPEQCRGEDTGPACDVYSAGLVFYEMLSGAQPFHGTDAATLMAQHLFVEPTPLRQIAPHVSAGVAAAVHAALAKQPADRPTASALRAALAAAAVGADPQALGERAAALRHEVAGIGRGERAIGGAGASAEASASAGGSAVVWIRAAERGAMIRGCLASAGMACSVTGGDAPPNVGAGGGVVVIVSAQDGIERVTRLRADAPGVPIVVVDVQAPGETTEAIRAGASDMLLRGAPDADLVAKLARLLRRHGRS
jgi:tRNA A-37 threonylcarbamoyl transferase component Bud32